MSKNVIANRYEVVQHIGQGGMADVFRAVDTILNREVAIKILRADLSTDAVSILRFEREAQAATALAHPNIVEIYDVGDYKGHHYIVMEYVPGKTLKQVIRSRGPLLNEEAVDIMKQLTSAVAEAHSRGIIHRDIKPQNVIVKADGSVKILDFGIAMAKGSMQLTQANNVMGSVHYLAPELAKGESASAQSDIYALGIVFYEMLSGDVPYKADQAVQVALKHLREPMPDILEKNPTVPQPVANIITRATAKDPLQRYRSCDQMWRDLSTCLRPERANEPPLVIPVAQTEKKPNPQENKTAKPQNKTEDETPKRTGKNGKKDGTRNKYLPLLIGLISLIVAGGVFAALVFGGVIRFGPAMVKVPDIEYLTLEDAKLLLEENELVLDANVAYELTDNVEKGKIISVDPPITTEVEEGTTVKVTVSSGIGVYIEDFAAMNMSIQEVQEYIESKKGDDGPYRLLKVSVEEKESDEEPGRVIGQEGLAPGTMFNPEVTNQITLIYSAYETITIPADLIGKPTSEAVAELESMGVTALVSNIDIGSYTQEQLDEIVWDVVVETDPPVNSTYTQREDNYVTLYYY